MAEEVEPNPPAIRGGGGSSSNHADIKPSSKHHRDLDLEPETDINPWTTRLKPSESDHPLIQRHLRQALSSCPPTEAETLVKVCTGILFDLDTPQADPLHSILRPFLGAKPAHVFISKLWVSLLAAGCTVIKERSRKRFRERDYSSDEDYDRHRDRHRHRGRHRRSRRDRDYDDDRRHKRRRHRSRSRSGSRTRSASRSRSYSLSSTEERAKEIRRAERRARKKGRDRDIYLDDDRDRRRERRRERDRDRDRKRGRRNLDSHYRDDDGKNEIDDREHDRYPALKGRDGNIDRDNYGSKREKEVKCEDDGSEREKDKHIRRDRARDEDLSPSPPRRGDEPYYHSLSGDKGHQDDGPSRRRQDDRHGRRRDRDRDSKPRDEEEVNDRPPRQADYNTSTPRSGRERDSYRKDNRPNGYRSRKFGPDGLRRGDRFAGDTVDHGERHREASDKFDLRRTLQQAKSRSNEGDDANRLEHGKRDDEVDDVPKDRKQKENLNMKDTDKETSPTKGSGTTKKIVDPGSSSNALKLEELRSKVRASINKSTDN